MKVDEIIKRKRNPKIAKPTSKNDDVLPVNELANDVFNLKHENAIAKLKKTKFTKNEKFELERRIFFMDYNEDFHFTQEFKEKTKDSELSENELFDFLDKLFLICINYSMIYEYYNRFFNEVLEKYCENPDFEISELSKFPFLNMVYDWYNFIEDKKELCPHCRNEISSKDIYCKKCGKFVFGRRINE